MAGFIQNILWNSVEGFVEAGTRTAGGYAGNALIKAGDMIENSGRSVGEGIERRASNYGSAITGQSYQPSAKALPSTARKPALKRSHSSPAGTKAIGPTSKTPLGAKKNPPGGAGGKQLAAVKQTTSKSVNGGTQKAIAGPLKNNNTSKKQLPKPFPNNQPAGTKIKPSAATSKQSLNNAKGVAQSKAQDLPKPYGSNNAYPTEKKSAVKPGQPKPFTPPSTNNEKKNDKKPNMNKPYPGTNTLPGQASKTPVKKYKPLERMEGTAEKGKVQHIAV